MACFQQEMPLLRSTVLCTYICQRERHDQDTVSWLHLSSTSYLLLTSECIYLHNGRVKGCRVMLYILLANVNSRSPFAVARPSVWLSSVTFVRPTQAVEIFGNISTALGTLAVCWHPPKILRRSSQGTPPSGELNTTGVAKYNDFEHIEGYILETVQDGR